MHWAVIDIIFIVLIVITSIRGAFSGMIGELISLAALFISLLLAAVFYSDGAKWLQSRSSLEDAAAVLAFIAIFLLSFILLKMLQKGVVYLINETPFESVDKLLGFFFGILEGILLCFLVVYLLNFQTLFDTSAMVRDSRFVPYIERFLPALDASGHKIIDQLNV